AEDEERDARAKRPQALREAALYYARQGVPVFPLAPNSKAPIVRNGLDDATTDREQIERWWTRNPRANIGVRTGLWCDVIDIDEPPAGYFSFAQVRDAVTTVLGVVVTPCGGMHIYVPPTGNGNRARFLDGLDYRGVRGYV